DVPVVRVQQVRVRPIQSRRKSALVLEIIQGKITVAEAARQYEVQPSEIEDWIDQGEAGMDALKAKPPGAALHPGVSENPPVPFLPRVGGACSVLGRPMRRHRSLAPWRVGPRPLSPRKEAAGRK